MLKIKCFNDFGGWGVPILLINGDPADYIYASKFLKGKDKASLDDPNFAIYYDNKLITRSELKINKKECEDLVEIFNLISKNHGSGGHYYYDIDSLPEIELKISNREYPDEIFEEWE